MKGRPAVCFFLAFALLLCGAIAYAWYCSGKTLTGMDDANIFFTYAENMASGRGIVYGHNCEPVEGCTSMLWLLLCAFNFLVGWNELGVFGFTCACLFAAQAIWLAILHRLLRPECKTFLMPYGIYAILLLTSPGYALWMSVSLMDTSLWGLVFAALTYVLLDDAGRCPHGCKSIVMSAIPFAMAPLSRPEAMFFVPVCLILMALNRRAGGCRFGALWIYGGIFLLSLAGLTLFRLAYFGYPLPNTYYAKVSPSLGYNIMEGIKYVARCVTNGFPFLLLLLLIVGAISVLSRQVARWLVKREALPVLTLCVLWFLCFMVQPVLTGGDHFAFHRFYQPVYPLVCALLATIGARVLTKVADQINFRWLVVSAIIGAFFVFRPSLIDFRNNFYARNEFAIAQAGIETGLMLNALYPDASNRPRVGVVIAGGIARTYEGPIVDLMGLNDVHIAHFKGDRRGCKNHAAFEPSQFDSFDIDIMPIPPNDFMIRALKGMIICEPFCSTWRYGRLALRDNPSVGVSAFCKNSYLDACGLKYEFTDELVWTGECWTAVAMTESHARQP